MAQAFAYYNFQYDKATDPTADAGFLKYNSTGDIDATTGTRVVRKYFNNNTTFPSGYITMNDHWDNYWRHGPNEVLGWDGGLQGSGDGAKSLGIELANSQAFAQCQVEKVFQNVCLRPHRIWLIGHRSTRWSATSSWTSTCATCSQSPPFTAWATERSNRDERDKQCFRCSARRTRHMPC
jgi:hypothetical protein